MFLRIIKAIKQIFIINKILFINMTKENKIYTHLTKEEKLALFKIAQNLKNENPIILEIGSYLGASSCFLARGIKNKKGRLYCIDTWENNAMTEGIKDTYQEFLSNTKNFKNIIEPLRGLSYNVIEDFKNINKEIDLLFIDGDHSYEGCKTDWDLYSPLLTKNAIIIFHDTSWAEGVQKVINEEVIDKATKILHLPNMQAFILK